MKHRAKAVARSTSEVEAHLVAINKTQFKRPGKSYSLL